MLSILQERLEKSPSKPRKRMTRQETIVSAFSRVNSRNVSEDASATPSLTTGTSTTDSSSELTDSSAKEEERARACTRSRSNVTIYNENMISGQKCHSSRKNGEDVGSDAVPDKTTINDKDGDSRGQLLQEGVSARDEDWNLGTMRGDDLVSSTQKSAVLERRKSMRLHMLEHGSSSTEKTTSVLGKRGHGTDEAGIDTLQALKPTSRKPSPRPREAEMFSLEGPPAKRARFTELDMKQELSPELLPKWKPAKKLVKLWLSQGLYVGQDPGFDPRLTAARNKLKKPSEKYNSLKRNKAMPLPMFAGERTLDKGRDFKLPFDVFSPLPPGQPKPDEWKKTHKNVFIGDAADIWKKAKPQEYSTCECKAESGCGDDCHNRFMLYECDDNNCKVGFEHCTNRAFADLRQRCKAGGKYRIGVEVMKTIDRGYGVRANRTFQPNQIIVEYTGEIITQVECDDRMNKRYRDAECYYLMDFDQSMVLDATRGSIARFINHSCNPNCRMIKWTVSGKPRMALFAGDNGIMTGEELTYDYNFDPFSAKNVQECRCRAEDCRGVLGPKPKEMKDASRPFAIGDKKKFQQVMENAVRTVTKKGKIATSPTMRSGFADEKAHSTRRLSQVNLTIATTPQQQRLVRKASKRSLRRINQKTIQDKVNAKMRRRTTTTHSRRRTSMSALKSGNIKVTSQRRHSSKALLSESSAAVEEENIVGESISRRGNIKTESASFTASAPRTLRRSERGTPGKSIWVVGDDEFKGWR